MFVKDRKILFYIIICLMILIFITIFLIYDYWNNKKSKLSEANNNHMPYSLEKFIPQEGSLMYIFFNEKNSNCLTMSKTFRKALFFAIDREDIQNVKNDSIKASTFLFTKNFWTKNQKFLPLPQLNLSQESQEIYKENDFSKKGYDFDKALNCLYEAWKNLSESDKNQSYQLKINFDFFYEGVESSKNNIDNGQIKTKIKNSIKKLFDEFNKQMKSQKLEIIEINEKTEASLILETFPSINDAEEELLIEKQDFYYYCFNTLLENIPEYYNPQTPIKFKLNFKKIKDYLDKKIAQGNTVTIPILTGLAINSNESLSTEQEKYSLSFPPLNAEGFFEGTIREFMSFYEECISGEEGLFKTYGGSSFKITEDELKEVQQQTYQEIFEKIFYFIAKEYFIIPLAVIS